MAHVKAQRVRGDAELLRLAADKQQANLEKLRTWSAEVVIDTKVESGEGLLVNTSELVSFAYDRAQGTHWDWIPADEKAKMADSGGQTSPGSGHTGVISVKDGVIYYRPAHPSAELRREQRVALNRLPGNPAIRPGITHNNFDPLYFYRVRDMDIAKRLLFYHGLAKVKDPGDHGRVDRSIERAGSLITLKVRDASVLNQIEVDLDRAGNLVRYVAEERSDVLTGGEEWIYEYEQISDVWVPKLISLAMGDSRNQKKSVVSRWLKNEVNDAVSPDKFNLQALGVRDGDRVQDQRTHTEYVYGAAAPLPPPRAN